MISKCHVFANEEGDVEASCLVSRNESSFKYFKSVASSSPHSCAMWQAVCPVDPAAYVCSMVMARQAADSQEIVLFETQDTGVTWIAVGSFLKSFSECPCFIYVFGRLFLLNGQSMRNVLFLLRGSLSDTSRGETRHLLNRLCWFRRHRRLISRTHVTVSCPQSRELLRGEWMKAVLTGHLPAEYFSNLHIPVCRFNGLFFF